LGGQVLVDAVFGRQLQGDAHEVEAVHRYPTRAVGLVDVAAGGELHRAAVEDADVVQPEKAALEDVQALAVLAVDPPGEVEQQLVKDALEEGAVAPLSLTAAAVQVAVDLV